MGEVRGWWLLALAAPVLFGRDLYLMPSTFDLVVGQAYTVGIHLGEGFPRSEESSPLELIEAPSLHVGRWAYPLANARVDGERVVVDAVSRGRGSSIVSVRRAPRRQELSAEQFTAYLEQEGAAQALDYRKQHGEAAAAGRVMVTRLAKAIVRCAEPSDGGMQVIGHTLEIVPLRNPENAIPGSKLPLRVLLRGKPAAGLRVKLAHTNGERKVVGVTDGDGAVTMLVPRNGIFKVHVTAIERREQRSEADWDALTATLVFEIR